MHCLCRCLEFKIINCFDWEHFQDSRLYRCRVGSFRLMQLPNSVGQRRRQSDGSWRGLLHGSHQDEGLMLYDTAESVFLIWHSEKIMTRPHTWVNHLHASYLPLPLLALWFAYPGDCGELFGQRGEACCGSMASQAIIGMWKFAAQKHHETSLDISLCRCVLVKGCAHHHQWCFDLVCQGHGASILQRCPASVHQGCRHHLRNERSANH